MSEVLRAYISEIDRTRQDINRVKGKQLHSAAHRNKLRTTLEKYFNEVRPSILGNREQADIVNNVDERIQELIVLCHKHGSVQRYAQLLAEAKKYLITIDSKLVSSSVFREQVQALDTLDSQIIKTLQEMLPSAALSYQQALLDLRLEERLSWRGPATDLREALRETLDYLAPDAEVEGMSGYKKTPDTNGPTMKQKVRFILKKRGLSRALTEPTEAAADSVDETVGTFVRSVYTRSNVSTHTPTNKTEVMRIRDFVKVVLCELLEIHSK